MAWVLGGLAGITSFWLALEFYGWVLPLVVPGELWHHQDAELLLRGCALAASVLVGTVLADCVYQAMARAWER